METATQILRGTAWNWLALGVTAAVSFVMSPFIVHHLGNGAYGTWILVNSLVAYLSLLDLGMRSTLTKFVSNNYVNQNHDAASQSVSAALWFRLWVAAAIILISVLLAVFATKVLHLHPKLLTAARWTIAFNGATVALVMLFGVFGGVLAGLNLFGRLSVISASQSILNAVGVYILLSRGHGIVSMAVLQFALAAIMGIVLMVLVAQAYPELTLKLGKIPEIRVAKQLWSYSLWIFIILVSRQLKYYTDSIVIGLFMPIGAVALYGIGAALTNYLRELISATTTAFMPAASALEAKGNYAELRQLVLHGTRLVLLIVLPIEIGFLMRGPTFIRLWMGAEYSSTSGHVLQVLTIAWVFMAANSCNGNVAIGLAKHKPVALWSIAEGAFNLALSIGLVRRFGIIGVAWGTVIPSLFVNAIWWPTHITRVLNVPIWSYVWQAWIRPGIALVPFAIASYLAERYWAATHIWQFIAQMLALLPVALAGALLCFREELTAKYEIWRKTKVGVEVR